MPSLLRVAFGTITVAVLIAAPVALALHQQAQTRNFRVVREGVLYRSGQMTTAGIQRMIHDYGIRTIVSLRDSPNGSRPAPDLAEELLAKNLGLNHFRFSPLSWDTTNGPAEVEGNVQAFLGIMRDPKNHPVLVHCFAGIHRAGAYTAVYRMEMEKWPNADAMAEMKACGYVTLNEELDILGFMEQFTPSWKKNSAESDKGNLATTGE